MPDEELRAKILEGKTELEQLGFKASWALNDLAKYFERQRDTRYYKVNDIMRQTEKLWQ